MHNKDTHLDIEFITSSAGFQFFPWFFSGNFMIFNLIGVPFFKADNIDSYLSGTVIQVLFCVGRHL